MNNIPKPEFKWYFGLPFAKVWNKGARDYHKDRERYDLSFLTDSQKIRFYQAKMIYEADAIIYLLITTLWSILPPLITLPNWLTWMNLGLENFGRGNYGNQLILTLFPGLVGTLIHKLPKMLPLKKGRLIFEVILKLLPVIILLLSYYLIHTEKKFREILKIEKQAAKQKIINNITGQDTT